MGTMTNDLPLGRDCMGAFNYLPECFSDKDRP